MVIPSFPAEHQQVWTPQDGATVVFSPSWFPLKPPKTTHPNGLSPTWNTSESLAKWSEPGSPEVHVG